MRLYRRLLLVATLLAFGVIALGAYVRLSDAGLGCPDWPGCYGHWRVPAAAHEQLSALQAFPERPINTGKAWKEMIHRYLAASLGLLIFTLCLLSWRGEVRKHRSPTLPTLLVAIVGTQAALGMWTVTLLLKPLIVTLHLLGGMTTLSLLVGIGLAGRGQCGPLAAGTRLLAAAALLAIVIQIAMGGWVSSNYAALACPDFPLCQAQWHPPMDFGQAFSLHRELGMTADGQLLPLEALTAIHWTHRLSALAVALIVGALSVALLRSADSRWRRWGRIVPTLLLIQIGLGIANVLLALPLALAVAHNIGAAALLTAVVAVNVRINSRPRVLSP